MNKESLKKQIKKKFGKYSNFARAANWNRYELQRDFLTKRRVDDDTLKKVARLVSTLSHEVPPRSDRNTAKKIKSLRRALNDAGGVIKFCRENPAFSTGTVFKVLAGDQRYIGGNGKVMKRLFEHFGL